MAPQVKPYPLYSFKLFSKVTGVVAIILGALVLTGWVSDIIILKSVLPGQVSMNPATAFAFIVAGVSLWLQREEGAVQRRRVAYGCAVVVIMIGLLKLCDYILGWNIGLDQHLFREKLGETGAYPPNRMAPNTALNFVLLGIALIITDIKTRHGYYPAQFFALIVLLTSGLALTGYAYSITSFYGVGSYIPMALNTALAFTLLSLGVLFRRPNRGNIALLTSNSAGGLMARRLLPAIIGVPLLVGWFWLAGERAGLYNSSSGISLMVVSNILIFGILVWANAGALDRMELERKRTEEERDRFFNLSLDMLSIAGDDGYFKQLNPAWESILGWTDEELLSKPYLEFVHPEDRESTIAEAQKLSRGIFSISFENRYICKDGTYKWLQWKAIPLPDKQLIYASTRDIHDRKEADDAIKRLNEDLRSNAAKLETANKELEAFAYSVSHDLRAPLRGIDGFSQALLNNYADRLDEQGKDYLQRVRAASQRMAQLIGDMLDLSRISRSEMQQTKVDLSLSVKTIADELRQSHPARQLEWKIAEGVVVTGDARLLHQALENLLSNAWKFTEKHPRAVIEFGVTSRDGRPVYFVRDDGAGFDMAYAQKLFGVFQRLHTVTDFAGTGVGLAIVQRVIHRHGGRVWAEAEIEKGATFYFTL